MELLLDGRRVHYLDQGEGLPVLLLHGWAAPAETYRLLIDHLSSYCRVVAPDLPGFGGSEEPPSVWSVDDYVEFTRQFAEAVGLTSPVLLCHSFGGRIAIKLLSRTPCPLTVTKAVFLDAAGIRPPRGLRYYWRVYRYKLGKRLLRLPGIRTLFMAKAEELRANAGSADYRNASARMRGVMSRAINEDLTALLPAIRASVLLIWGERDTATPLTDGQLMEKRIPDAGLVVLRGAGHFSFADCWGQCSRVLDAFLKP